MNSRHYEKLRNQQLKEILEKANITNYKTVCLSADQQEYEIELLDGSFVKILSGLPVHYD